MSSPVVGHAGRRSGRFSSRPDVLALLLAAFVVLPTTQVSAQWSWSPFVFHDHVWMRSFDNGQPMFDYRIGAGGAIAELRSIPDGFQRLLSPTFNGELTDRVIQYTTWSETITNPVPGLPQFEHRYNVTQAGTFSGLISPTMAVEVDATRQTVDVWSVPQDQWRSQQQAAMQSATSTLTRYEMVADGVLKVRRILRVGDVLLNGSLTSFDHLYLEAWTPVDRSSDTFTALALSLDASGTPNWWYRAGFNIPRYPQFDVASTKGYAVAFNEQTPFDSTALGVVFGRQPVASSGASDVHRFNSMDWNNGIGLLPGMHLYDVDTGTIIDQTLYLVPRAGLDAETSDLLTDLATQVSAPAVYRPGTIFQGELDHIVRRLNQQVGTRADALGPLVEFVGGGSGVSVPEPSTLLLCGISLTCMLWRHRRPAA